MGIKRILFWLLSLSIMGLPTVAVARPTPFYRVRLVYSTTSDWSTLDLQEAEDVLSTRLVSVQGGAAQVGTSNHHWAIHSSQAEAHPVTAVVELALFAPHLPTELHFVLQRGGRGVATVQVSSASVGRLADVVHADKVPADLGHNPKAFTVDTTRLRQSPPLSATVPRVDAPRLVWAFYYPWYHRRDWTSPLLLDHPTPRYDSADRATIERQVALAQSCGIDGFLCSWKGPDSPSDHVLQMLLDVAAQRHFRVAVNLETLDHNQPRPPEVLFDWLRYLAGTYRKAPAYQCVDGRPVVVVWASRTVPRETWQGIFTRLQAEGLDVFRIAEGYDPASLDVFDGMHKYELATVADVPRTVREAGLCTRYRALLDAVPHPRLWAATVNTGYDSTKLPGGVPAWKKDRDEGRFYLTTFEAAIKSDPDWIFVTSWNEWWENSAVEPGERYGNKYMDLTRGQVVRWRHLQGLLACDWLPDAVSPVPQGTDLDALDAQFRVLRPDDKKTFLDTLRKDTPDLATRWDAYQTERQTAFAAAHPPVPRLDAETERAVRQGLHRKYAHLVEKLNVGAPVDSDGAGEAYGDYETDFDTSVRVDGAPLNADEVLYHVATMDHPEWYGCLAIHFIHGRMVPSIFGDEGPAYGEASHLTIQLLGLYSSPIDGGDNQGHDMYLIPDLGAEFMQLGRPATLENLTRFCHDKGVPGF